MASILTLEERKRDRADEIRAGFALLREALAEYGRIHGGRFLVYGSAATGQFHYESDIDVLADFGEAELADALRYVEKTCAGLRLRADVQPLAWCTPEFIERVSRSALALP